METSIRVWGNSPQSTRRTPSLLSVCLNCVGCIDTAFQCLRRCCTCLNNESRKTQEIKTYCGGCHSDNRPAYLRFQHGLLVCSGRIRSLQATRSELLAAALADGPDAHDSKGGRLLWVGHALEGYLQTHTPVGQPQRPAKLANGCLLCVARTPVGQRDTHALAMSNKLSWSTNAM